MPIASCLAFPLAFFFSKKETDLPDSANETDLVQSILAEHQAPVDYVVVNQLRPLKNVGEQVYLAENLFPKRTGAKDARRKREAAHFKTQTKAQTLKLQKIQLSAKKIKNEAEKKLFDLSLPHFSRVNFLNFQCEGQSFLNVRLTLTQIF